MVSKWIFPAGESCRLSALFWYIQLSIPWVLLAQSMLEQEIFMSLFYRSSCSECTIGNENIKQDYFVTNIISNREEDQQLHIITNIKNEFIVITVSSIKGLSWNRKWWPIHKIGHQYNICGCLILLIEGDTALIVYQAKLCTFSSACAWYYNSVPYSWTD